VDEAGIKYEGKAVIELENMAREAEDEKVGYPFALLDGIIELGPMWTALLVDLEVGIAGERITARFHNGLAAGIADSSVQLCAQLQLDTVALSGGVFQNRTLFNLLAQQHEGCKLRVLGHSQVPSNDGGIALGQAVIAAVRLLPPGGS